MARRRETVEPSYEHGVQFFLADLDRRIAPDHVESQRVVDVVGSLHVDVGDLEAMGIVGSEFTRSLVHVDGDDARAGSTASEDQ